MFPEQRMAENTAKWRHGLGSAGKNKIQRNCGTDDWEGRLKQTLCVLCVRYPRSAKFVEKPAPPPLYKHLIRLKNTFLDLIDNIPFGLHSTPPTACPRISLSFSRLRQVPSGTIKHDLNLHSPFLMTGNWERYPWLDVICKVLNSKVQIWPLERRNYARRLYSFPLQHFIVQWLSDIVRYVLENAFKRMANDDTFPFSRSITSHYHLFIYATSGIARRRWWWKKCSKKKMTSRLEDSRAG